MEAWESYLVANVGAAAALLGLLFIGVSINLERILKVPGLPTRAIETLALFGAVLVTSSLLLVPDQADWVAGVWVVVIGLALMETSIISARAGKDAIPPGLERAYVARVAASLLTATLYVVGGVILAVGTGDGLYVVAGAVTLSYLFGIANAWVLLVEINR